MECPLIYGQTQVTWMASSKKEEEEEEESSETNHVWSSSEPNSEDSEMMGKGPGKATGQGTGKGLGKGSSQLFEPKLEPVLDPVVEPVFDPLASAMRKASTLMRKCKKSKAKKEAPGSRCSKSSRAASNVARVTSMVTCVLPRDLRGRVASSTSIMVTNR